MHHFQPWLGIVLLCLALQVRQRRAFKDSRKDVVTFEQLMQNKEQLMAALQEFQRQQVSLLASVIDGMVWDAVFGCMPRGSLLSHL